MKMQAFPTPRKRAEDLGMGGLALMAFSTATEVCEGITERQAHGFFVAIGRRMAVLEPLEDVTDTASLVVCINRFWDALGWGEMELETTEDALIVRHRGLPKDFAPDPRGHWAIMLSGALEGAYDSWFRALGSAATLRTRSEWKGDMLELRHGH